MLAIIALLCLYIILIAILAIYVLILSFVVASFSRLFITLHFLLDFRDPLNPEKDNI